MGQPDLSATPTSEEYIEALDGEKPGSFGESAGDSPTPEAQEIPTATGEDVIALLEMAISGAFYAVSGFAKVGMDPEIEAMAHLSDPEKASLRPYAPFVAPYIPKMMQHQDKIGIFFFALVSIKLTKSKLTALKKYIEEKVEIREQQDQSVVDKGREPEHF